MSHLGSPGGTAPKREKTCPRPICTIMQNFTPIGATVAETSATAEQRKKTANLVPCHTNVRQVKIGSLVSILGPMSLKTRSIATNDIGDIVGWLVGHADVYIAAKRIKLQQFPPHSATLLDGDLNQ